MKEFILQHEASIGELNYFELAKFMDKVNTREKIEAIVQEKGYKVIETIEAYRRLLYDEFEIENSVERNLTETNTIELLMEAEDNYSRNRAFEREASIEKYSENMKVYLNDPGET